MRVADTSFLYAAFNDRDVHHEDAIAQLAQRGCIEIAAPILTEFLNVVQYRQGHGVAVEIAKALRRLPHVRIVGLEDVDLVEALWSKEPRLSHADAVAIIHARRSAATLLSFAKRQLAAI